MHSANSAPLPTLSSISPETGRRWGEAAHAGWTPDSTPADRQPLFLKCMLQFGFFLSFWKSPALGEGGRCGWGAEGSGFRGQESICTGSLSDSGTCTCRRRTAGVGPDPGCFWGPRCAAPLGSFSGRPLPPGRGTPGGCWIHSALLRSHTQIIRK